ncbi:hypothetical protein BBK14_14575 [Parafrankia soli]|uniref:Glycoside hydrolase family 5 C-terminal domain-containing protein n=1 Tax=Parafrankia soli TaxID=2599596 RepID=A0A1S1QPY5_9ACTN|nr:hypothetical protein BBK14_14575 [Parafrankia soli]
MRGFAGGSRKGDGRRGGRPARWATVVLAAALLPSYVGIGMSGRAAATTARVSTSTPAQPPASVPGGAGAPTAVAPQVPPGTVTRTGTHLTDSAGRVVLPRGVTVPAGRVPTAGEIAQWLDFGFTGLRLEIPMTRGGLFPPSGEAPPPGDRELGGLDQAGMVVRELTGRGFTVVLRIVPGAAGYTPSAADLTSGLTRLAGRFGGVAGLIGYEVPAGVGSADLAGAVRAVDTNHTLWVEQPAPFDPAARVAAAEGAGYVTGWVDGSARRAAALADAGDAFGLGWFFDGPAVESSATGIGPGEVRALTAPPAEIVRPYPAAVAGAPESFKRDGAGVFRLVYQPSRAGGGTFAPGTATAVVLPAWAYPSGYQARVTGGQVTSPPGAGVLCVVAGAGATRVSVEVTPAAGAPAPVAPTRAGAANCAAAPGAGPGSVGAAAGQPPSGAPAATSAADDSDPVLLLLVLPLLGAAAAAAVLGPVFVRLRRR